MSTSLHKKILDSSRVEVRDGSSVLVYMCLFAVKEPDSPSNTHQGMLVASQINKGKCRSSLI